MSLKHDLQDRISTVINAHIPEIQDIYLERPKQADHGDYASNVCLRMAKVFKKAPKQIAEELAEKIQADLSDLCTVTPINGFLNFTCTDAVVWDYAQKELSFPKKEDKILLEYVSANPTGPLHIGHGRWAAIGDVLYRLLDATGHNVDREFYINDAGNQINNLRDSVEAVRNNQEIPEGGYHGAYIKDLATESGDPKDLLLGLQKETLAKMDVEFDRWYSELELHQGTQIQECLAQLKEAGASYEKDGALWFNSTKFGDDKDRVLIKSDGQYTYFAVDIAYHYDKIKRNYTSLINIWGADHHGYVPRVTAAVDVLRRATPHPEFASQHSDQAPRHSGLDDDGNENYLTVVLGQLVSLYRDGEQVRMSKRTGEMITLDEVIDEIGKDATRYFLIEKSADIHIDFDLELAKKTSNENPVYYVQYAHARLCSIERQFETPEGDYDTSSEALEPAERRLLLHCARVSETIEIAAKNLAPYQFVQYLSDCARAWHSFYEHCPILKSEGKTQEKRRKILSICKATLSLSLRLCGLNAPEKM